MLTHDTWYLKTLFKPSLFKSSCFKHLNIPWLMKHGLNPLYHKIKHVMINETWFKPSLLTKRFPLGTEWDLHDFLGPLPSFPCITWLPKTFSFRYRMGHSWLPWHPCWDDIHAEMTSMLRWHPCWDDIHAEMTCWHILIHPDTWYLKTLFKPSCFKPSWFKPSLHHEWLVMWRELQGLL